AGTSDGKVFVQMPNLPSGVSFPNRSTGLPAGGRINGITVDPSNPAIAYAMLTTAGGGGGVWKTTNAGLRWTQVAGLPNQPTYALVIDQRQASGAPSGFLYVGTQVGVFASITNGATWSALGAALPSAPVVDLQFNASLNELVAGVQGRGVFE